MHLLSVRLVAASIALAAAPLTFAQSAASFSDLPTTHPAYAAVEYLKSQGIIQGYADGTFKPNQTVNRAEAVKILVAPLVSSADLAAMTTSSYTDVPAGSWYLSYVELANQKMHIIDGPPKSSVFRPTLPVTKAEYFKLLELSQGADPAGAYKEIRLPMSSDVQNPDDWFYPYMRYALASSMMTVNVDGTLAPAKTLTRSDVAIFLYRYLMFKQNRRTQALLSETENEIVNVLQQLDAKDSDQASFASARALIAARGALTSKPDEPLVKGALKIAEGFQMLVQAYKAGAEGRLEDVLKLAGDAWKTAEKAREFSPSLATLATQMQTIAKNMADSARALQAQQN